MRWLLGADELEAPVLEIYTPARSDLTVEIEYRLGIDGETISWSSGPWLPEELEVILAPVEVPVEALWAPEQEWRLSAMTVEVSAWIGDTLVHVSSVETLRVAFPYGPEDPIFLDADRMESLAPGGVLLSSPVSAEGPWETIEPMPPLVPDPNREIVRVEEQEEN
jgi:hypothetical protein